MQPAFAVLVEEWHECEEFEPKPKDKLVFVNTKRGTSCGVVCGHEQTPWYEVWTEH